MKLHNYWRSSSSWRVRVALHHKGLDFEYVAVDLLRNGGEQLSRQFRALNPMAQVPLLEIEDEERPVLITQSVAIVEYLEERWPEPRLLPTDLFSRARVRQLVETVNSGIQPFQNLALLVELERQGVDRNAWGAKFVREGLAALEAMAQLSAGTYLVGAQVTLADVYLVPQLYNARRFGVDLEPFPMLLRVERQCLELASFQRAAPDVQPDAPRPG